MASIPQPEPLYAWQVLDEDGAWGTMSVHIAFPASAVLGNNEHGHNVVLINRNEGLVRGPFREIALRHAKAWKKPVRLHRFIPDPDFQPEEL